MVAAGNEKNLDQDSSGDNFKAQNKLAAQGASGFDRGGYSKDAQIEKQKAGAMEVHVDHNIEKAMRILKRKLIKEGLFKELKSRRYYEKPSVRKKRKEKESQKKVRKEEARAKKNSLLMS